MNGSNHTDDETTDESTESATAETGAAHGGDTPNDGASGTVDRASDDAAQQQPPAGPPDAVGNGGAGATAQPPDGGPRAEESGGVSGSRLVTLVEYATFAILCLLALVATFRFYFATAEAIRLWFSPDFVPVFQAVFNLVVLLLAVLGISVLVRRIS